MDTYERDDDTLHEQQMKRLQETVDDFGIVVTPAQMEALVASAVLATNEWMVGEEA